MRHDTSEGHGQAGQGAHAWTPNETPNPEWLAVGRRIANIRGSYNQPVFAASINISVRTLQRIENGHRLVDADILASIWRVHAVSPDTVLLGNTDPRLMQVCPKPLDGGLPTLSVSPDYLGARRANEAPASFQLACHGWAAVEGLQIGQVAIGVLDTALPADPTLCAFELHGKRAVGTLAPVGDAHTDATRFAITLLDGQGGLVEPGEIQMIGRVNLVVTPTKRLAEATQALPARFSRPSLVLTAAIDAAPMEAPEPG